MELGMEGQEATELAALEKDLGIDSDVAVQVLGLIDGDLDPEDVADTLQYHSILKGASGALIAIDQLIDGHGIESVALEQDEYGYADWNSPSFEYVNTGDTYSATIVLYQGDFYLTTWGDAYEEWKIEPEEEEPDLENPEEEPDLENEAVISTPAWGKNTLTIEGKLVASSNDFDELVETFEKWAEDNSYWPNLYTVNERGSVELVERD